MTASKITSDTDLLDAAVGGDEEALRELLKRFGPRVRQTLRGRPGRKWQSILDEDDVMQVTYLEAFLHLDQLHRPPPTVAPPTAYRHTAHRNSGGGIRTHDLVVNSHPLCR